VVGADKSILLVLRLDMPQVPQAEIVKQYPKGGILMRQGGENRRKKHL